MRVLLDTHAFLWWITDAPELSPRARSLIADSDNRVYVSAASGWEIAIKAQIGKLVVPENPQQFIAEQIVANSFAVLPIRMEHALHILDLPMHHRDPFDRLLMAQSRVEGMPILTADSVFADYDVDVVW
jgi:PIN domain nuclease of toxin-antitoxin system